MRPTPAATGIVDEASTAGESYEQRAVTQVVDEERFGRLGALGRVDVSGAA